MKRELKGLLANTNDINIISIKRILGILCVIFGLSEKISLFIYSLFFADQILVNFNNLDSSANWLIGFGGAFLGLNLCERMLNNKK